jgi:hypothetical protein
VTKPRAGDKLIALSHNHCAGQTVDIEIIRKRVLEGNYLIKSHAIVHALKEGFERRQMIEAVLNGKVIEEYADDKRCLVCGAAALSEKISKPVAR